MKKIIATFMVVLAVFCLMSCAASPDKTPEKQKEDTALQNFPKLHESKSYPIGNICLRGVLDKDTELYFIGTKTNRQEYFLLTFVDANEEHESGTKRVPLKVKYYDTTGLPEPKYSDITGFITRDGMYGPVENIAHFKQNSYAMYHQVIVDEETMETEYKWEKFSNPDDDKWDPPLYWTAITSADPLNPGNGKVKFVETIYLENSRDSLTVKGEKENIEGFLAGIPEWTVIDITEIPTMPENIAKDIFYNSIRF